MLIASQKNFYFYNILYHQFDTIIQIDEKIKDVISLKSDLKVNIYLIGNNYNNEEGLIPPKDYIFVYKYKDIIGLDKIYEEEFKLKRIVDLEPLNGNENNKVALVLSYSTFFSGCKEYLQITNINI